MIQKEEDIKLEKIKCGLIMPISPIDGCTMEHWGEVKSILVEATCSITNYDITTTIVSEADDVGIIQKRIVQNIYNADIVICDVSCKNPNVMFELGMRLAFDKPTIIVKDDKTNYTFDTGVIEHLEYPRDLRFTKIVEFKKLLAKKIISTIEESRRNPDFSTFLKSFGSFDVVSIKQNEVTMDKAVFDGIEELKREVALLRKSNYEIDNNYIVRNYDSNYKSREGLSIKMPKKYLIDTIRESIVRFAKTNGISDINELERRLDLSESVIRDINAENFFSGKNEFMRLYEEVVDSFQDKELF